ncbi:hypothetical protein KFU94_08655 [Chloroflexi bacterium TSY]|nr:hypothetical protein [Chloroflexi bacterium TSY]
MHPRTKAFCVGQAKSGTASLHGLLATHHRSAHEPEREQTLEMILRESRGEVEAQNFGAYLIERDQRLNLDYDIAWANQFIIAHLLTNFPDAKFIVLIRDPHTWLQSTVGHLISREIPHDVQSFLDWWFKPDRYPHSRHDSTLEAHGLFSIAAFLTVWNQHVNICIQSVPPERRLVLRTHELNESHQRLSEFLQIPLDSLDPQNGHLNRSTWADRIESFVDSVYLNEMVDRICGENMANHFPEVSGIQDVYKLWKSGVAVD